VLALKIVDEWNEAGGTGCEFALAGDGRGGLLEIMEMATDNPRYNASFSLPVANDKIDLQLLTHSVDAWTDFLRGRWPFTGPQRLPWGHRWITLRDPDNVLIAIYEETQ
jgi:hypothetical protein